MKAKSAFKLAKSKSVRQKKNRKVYKSFNKCIRTIRKASKNGEMDCKVRLIIDIESMHRIKYLLERLGYYVEIHNAPLYMHRDSIYIYWGKS